MKFRIVKLNERISNEKNFSIEAMDNFHIRWRPFFGKCWRRSRPAWSTRRDLYEQEWEEKAVSTKHKDVVKGAAR